MRHLKLLVLAAMAMFAFAAVGASVAQAAPEILTLEAGSITGLTATFKGTTSTLSTLSGKTITGTKVEGKLKGCKEGASAKDTNLCEALLTFTGVKKEKTACRSETAGGTQDAVETVLVVTDLHLASEEETGTGKLQPLLLFKVLGQAGGEAELTINCATVKEKVKGVIGCLLTPGLKEITTNEEATVACVLNATTHDQTTGKCEQECNWLKEPFESNLGAGFEDAGMGVSATGKFTEDVLIDD